jgi:hypothetical protein
MNDDQLRELIRESIARHLSPSLAGQAPVDERRVAVHPSHTQFATLHRADADGACLIEPSVRCNHCGYCLSYGH